MISNRTSTVRLFDFEVTHMISDQIALHSVQLPLQITNIFPKKMAQMMSQNKNYVRKSYFMCLYFYCLGDLVTLMGEWEIQSVSGKLAKMHVCKGVSSFIDNPTLNSFLLLIFT